MKTVVVFDGLDEMVALLFDTEGHEVEQWVDEWSLLAMIAESQFYSKPEWRGEPRELLSSFQAYLSRGGVSEGDAIEVVTNNTADLILTIRCRKGEGFLITSTGRAH